MPNWVRKVKDGFFECMVCGSFMVQNFGIWICTDPTCLKYDDIPTEQRQVFAGWPVLNQSVGTSSQVSGSIVGNKAIEGW